LVVVDGERRIELTGRIAAMVRWLTGKQGREAPLNEAPCVRVEFNCAGSQIKPKCVFYENEVPIRV